jgi:hypothetical protein
MRTKALIPCLLASFWSFPQIAFVDEKTYNSIRSVPKIIVNENNMK